MKNLAIISVLVLQFLAASVYGQQAFTGVALNNNKNDLKISFTLPSEANVTYYRIEAATDTANFNIIDRVHSLGNTVLPRTYNYKVYNDGYSYFRICKVNMNGTIQYSNILSYCNAPRPHFQQDPKAESKLYANGR